MSPSSISNGKEMKRNLEGEGEIELPRPVSTVTQADNLQAVYD
jgi:hypothetical protein